MVLRRTLTFLVFSSFLLCLFASQLSFLTAAAEQSAWISPEPHNVELLTDFGSAAPLWLRTGNSDCTKERIKLRNQLRIGFTVYTEIAQDACVVNALYGSSTGSYLRMPGSELYGYLARDSNGNTSRPMMVTPVPGSSSALQVTAFGSSPGMSRYALIRDFGSTLERKVRTDRSYFFYKKPGTELSAITGKDGSVPYLRAHTVGFSNNGTWMVVDAGTSSEVMKVNLETLESMPVSPGHQYGNGSSPDPYLAISNDGRYVAVGEKSNTKGEIKVVDTHSCNTQLSWDDIIGSCKSRIHKLTIPSGVKRISALRFVNNYTLKFLASYEDGEQHYLLSPSGKQTNYSGYLALGDSFAAGEGAYSYKSITDTDDNQCHISLLSYPYLLGTQLGTTAESIACSGATTYDVNGVAESYTRPQAKGKAAEIFTNEIITGLLPGYRTQSQHLTFHKPSISTISIGGNDIGFAKKLKICVEADTCFPTYEDRLEILYEIDRLVPELTRTYTQLLSANPKTQLYVVGYPSIIKEDGDCGVNVRFNSAEAVFANQLVSYLNKSVEIAAKRAGVFYVDVEDALDGQRLCETMGSNTAVNGLTAGNSDLKVFGRKISEGPLGSESFHPNKLGHLRLANKIKQKTFSFTAPMPSPNPDLSLMQKDNLDILNVPKTNRALNVVNFDLDPNNNVLYKFKPIDVLRTPTVQFAPNTTVRFVLRSDPVELGTTETNDNGEYAAQLVVPESVPPGYHTLHTYGTSVAGEPMDVQRIVYVAETENDIDGDGILNSDEICLYGEPSGQDEDQDGIDDACDPFIGESPTLSPEEDSSSPNDADDPMELPGFGTNDPEEPTGLPGFDVVSPEDPNAPQHDPKTESNPETIAGNEPTVVTEPEPEQETENTEVAVTPETPTPQAPNPTQNEQNTNTNVLSESVTSEPKPNKQALQQPEPKFAQITNNPNNESGFPFLYFSLFAVVCAAFTFAARAFHKK